MPPLMRRIVGDLWYPAALILAAWAFGARLAPLGPIWSWLPLALCALGLLAAIWFRRSRTAFAFVLIAIATLVLDHLMGAQPPDRGVVGRMIFPALMFLLPINIAGLCFLRERGVLTLWGGYRLSLIVNQVVLVALFATGLFGILSPAGGEALWRFFAEQLQSRLLPAGVDGWTPLPQLALLATLGGIAAVAVRYLRNGTPFESGMAAALLAVAIAGHVPALAALWLTVAALILLLSLAHDLNRLAYLDELTGLPARRALLGHMSSLSDDYTIAMLDVDHFKAFNDTYGHDVGDQVLKMVAGCLSRVKGGGRPFRYGGEEFTIVFAGKDGEAALPFLEAVREAVAASAFTLRAEDRPKKRPKDLPTGGVAGPRDQVGVTISIGLADRQPDHGGPDDVLKAADTALYRAKQAGRNCTSR